MPTDLEFIQGFSALFAHLSGEKLKSPLGATAYYTLLIKNFPTNFKAITRDARKAMGEAINASKLKTGREELLERGFIAKVLPVHGNVDFNREMYLPISPEFIWQDNVPGLIDVVSTEGIAQRFELIKALQDIYKSNFGKYGVKIEDGCITVFHSSQWLLYFLAHNVGYNKNISMLLGTLGSFQEPYIRYYKIMLKAGLNTRIICDQAAKETIKGIKNINKLKKDYPNTIQIKATPIPYGTSRRMIYDNLAVDGKKLMANEGDLSYISTIYAQEELIARMRNVFEAAFRESLELTSEVSE